MERAIQSLASVLGVRLVVDGLKFPNAVHVDVEATEVEAFASRIEDAHGPVGVCCERRMATQNEK